MLPVKRSVPVRTISERPVGKTRADTRPWIPGAAEAKASDPPPTERNRAPPKLNCAAARADDMKIFPEGRSPLVSAVSINLVMVSPGLRESCDGGVEKHLRSPPLPRRTRRARRAWTERLVTRNLLSKPKLAIIPRERNFISFQQQLKVSL